MDKDYFQSKEFKELLASYEKDREEGRSIYLDADDFADIADYYINADQCDKAMEAVEMGLAIHPDEEVLYVVKSAAYIYQREYDKAEQILKELDSSNSDVKYQLAQLRYAKYDDTEGAEAIWREWMQMEDGEPLSEQQQRDAYIHIISSLVELREGALGFKNFDEEVVARWVREYISKFQPLGRSDDDVQLVDICRENDLAELMSEVLTQVLEERPYMPKGWSNLALAQYLSMQYEQALDSCAFALAIDANDLDAMLTRAHTLHAMGEKEMAKVAFKEYLDKGGEAPQIIPYAELLLADEEDDEAVAQMNKLFSFITEKKRQAEENLRDAEKNHADDPKYLEQARTFNEDARDAYERIVSDMGDLYQRNFFYEESIVMYKNVAQVNEKNADAHFMMGINYLALSSYEEAGKHFAEAMKKAIDPVMMGVDIALTFALNDYSDFAFQMLDTVSQIAENSDSPFDRNIPAVKSLIYLKMGKIDQFQENFKVACEKTPGFARQVYHGCFPQGLPVDKWYDYAMENLDDLQKKLRKERTRLE